MGDPAGTYRQHGCVFQFVRFFVVIVLLGGGAFGGWYVYKTMVEKDKDLLNKGIFGAASDKIDEAKELMDTLNEDAKKVVKGKIALAKERLLKKRKTAAPAPVGKDAGTMRSALEGLSNVPPAPPVKNQPKSELDEPVNTPENNALAQPVEKSVEPVQPVERPKETEPPTETEPSEPAEQTAPVGSPDAEIPAGLSPLEEKQLTAFNLVEEGDKLFAQASENDWDTPTLKKAEANYRKALDLLKAAYAENPSDKTMLESIQYINTCLFDVNKQKRLE